MFRKFWVPFKSKAKYFDVRVEEVGGSMQWLDVWIERGGTHYVTKPFLKPNHFGVPLVFPSAHPPSNLAWPKARIKQLKQLCSDPSDPCVEVISQFSARLCRGGLSESQVQQLVDGPCTIGSADLNPVNGNNNTSYVHNTSWLPLSYHPALRGSGVGSALRKMCGDSMCKYLYKEGFHDAPSMQGHPMIRVAWKNSLPSLSKLLCNKFVPLPNPVLEP